MWGDFVDSLVDTGYTGDCTGSPPSPDKQHTQPPPTRLPAARRLVAIGDLHGDLSKAQRAFRLAGLTDDTNNWAGGDTVCVQVGDILDRGDQELRILYFLEKLEGQAAAAGGRLYVLNGNHETMNVGGNFRYATTGASMEMALWHRWQQLGDRLRGRCGCSSVAEDVPSSSGVALPVGGPAGSAAQYNPQRYAYLHPGGAVTRRFFAHHPTVLQVGSTLFVHGGVLPSHVEYGLERINAETQAWLLGSSGPAPPRFLRGASAIVWARDYSAQPEASCNCAQLAAVLGALPGAARMVVGHTIQEGGINAACGGAVLRVDVGMSRGCGDGGVEVLEIEGDGASVARLREGAEGTAREALTAAGSRGEAAAAGAAAERQPEGRRERQRAEAGGGGGGAATAGGEGALAAIVRRLWQQRTASASSSGGGGISAGGGGGAGGGSGHEAGRSAGQPHASPS